MNGSIKAAAEKAEGDLSGSSSAAFDEASRVETVTVGWKPCAREKTEEKRMKMLVTGAGGFVGQGIMKAFRNAVAAPSLRGATAEEIRRVVEESEADVIVHTAAISDIGACQADPEASWQANVRLPCDLARAAAGKKLICFSSDQVYCACGEEGPYTEDDAAPGNIYAEHKREMEQRVLDLLPSAVMLRAEWMYDVWNGKSNYYMNILRAEGEVAFSSGQYRGVTYLKEVTENMEKVFALPGGVYNFGSETTLSIYEITKRFAAMIGKRITVKDAPAGHNLWMNCGKAGAYGVCFSSVLDGLLRCASDHPPEPERGRK